MRSVRIRVLACAVGALALAGACSKSDTGGAVETEAPAASVAPASAMTGSVSAADQTGDGKTLKVASVTIAGASGFIAVHIDQGGAPGPVVGHVAVKEGTTAGVTVPLDSAQKTGKFWPMLHVDKGVAGTYEFPGP